MKSLIVVFSYHHKNTQRVAEVMAKVLDAQVKSPQQTVLEELSQYDLVGFGSGIDSGKHYKEILDFAHNLPQVTNKKAFVFSTSGVSPNFVSRSHFVKDSKIMIISLTRKADAMESQTKGTMSLRCSYQQ